MESNVDDNHHADLLCKAEVEETADMEEIVVTEEFSHVSASETTSSLSQELTGNEMDIILRNLPKTLAADNKQSYLSASKELFDKLLSKVETKDVRFAAALHSQVARADAVIRALENKPDIQPFAAISPYEPVNKRIQKQRHFSPRRRVRLEETKT